MRPALAVALALAVTLMLLLIAGWYAYLASGWYF